MPPPWLKYVANSAERALMFVSLSSFRSQPPQVSSDAVMMTEYFGLPAESTNATSLNAGSSFGFATWISLSSFRSQPPQVSSDAVMMTEYFGLPAESTNATSLNAGSSFGFATWISLS